LLAMMTFGFVGGILLLAPITAVHATSSANGSPHPDGIVVTPVPTTPSSPNDETDYDTTCPGGLAGCTLAAGVPVNSWSATIFSVTYTGTLAVTITDCCYEGDYYSLYQTTDTTGLTGWTLVGTTDQVFTGPELVAPTYDPYWTGTGVSYSSTTFFIPMSGTLLFADADGLLNSMVNLLGPSCGGGSAVVYSGCSVTGISASSGWSPAGYTISFEPASSAGCVSGGDTSWPAVTFTDGSTAGISVTGTTQTSPTTCADMNIEDLFGSQPAGTTTPSLSSPNYYDLGLSAITGGTATVCFTASGGSPTITSSTVMEYWNGNSWSMATDLVYTASTDTICGNVPVSALLTPSTPIVIGTPTTAPSVPEFGVPAMMVAAVGMLGLALVSRRLRPVLAR